MLLNRRDFVLCCSAFGAVTLLPTAGLAAPLRRGARFMPLQKLSFQTFAKQLNSSFEVEINDSSTLAVQLLQAKKGKVRRNNANGGAAYESFSLLFAGPRDIPLAQGTYRFGHSRIGRFDLFIVPVLSPDNESLRYEAIFNRPVIRSTKTSKTE